MPRSSPLRVLHKDPRPEGTPCPGLLPADGDGPVTRRGDCAHVIAAEESWSAHYIDNARCPDGCAAYAYAPLRPAVVSIGSTLADHVAEPCGPSPEARERKRERERGVKRPRPARADARDPYAVAQKVRARLTTTTP